MQQVGKDEQPGTESHLAFDHEPTAIADEDQHVDLSQEADGRLPGTEHPEDRLFLVLDRVVGLVETGDLLGLAGEAFDNVNALQVLNQCSDHGIAQFTGLAIGWLDKSRESTGSPPQ